MGLLNTAKKVATGLLDMDTPSRMARATDQGYSTDVYHGSTHDLTNMDAFKTNIEGDWGQGIYSSNNIDDVNSNYAGLGPDLTSRIDRRMDDIDSRIDGYEFEDLINAFPEMTEKEAKSIAAGNSEVFDKFKRRVATKEIAGPNSGVVYPLKLKTEDYAVIDQKNPTRIEGRDYQAEAADDLNKSDFGSDDDYENALYELADDLRSSDYDSPLETISQTLGNAGVDDYAISDILQEFYDGDSISAFDLDKAIRSAEIYAEDELGNMIPNGAISAEVFRDLGYKGVKDNTVNAKFPTMEGMSRDTTHYITFPQNEQTIRSVNAQFDPAKSNSTSLLASNPVATAAGLGGVLAMTGSEDADAGVVGSLVKMLAKGKADGTVVNYPDELIESTPFELRKAIADHNESVLGPEYRESFGDTTFYRGGGSEREALKNDVWMSSDPYQASTYAGQIGGNVMPLKVRKEGMPEVYSNSPEWNRIGLLDSSMKIPSNEYPEELGKVMFNSEQSPYAVTDTNKIAQFAKDEGFGGVSIKGLQDIGPYQRGADLSKVRRAESLMLGDGSNARSVNAAFDPAKASSSNLLASNPVATTSAGLLAMDNVGQESQGLMDAIAGRDAMLTPQQVEYLNNQRELQQLLGTQDTNKFNYADLAPMKRNKETGERSFAMTGLLRDIIEKAHDSIVQSQKTGITNQQSLWDIIL
jgi:hypothetical protein